MPFVSRRARLELGQSEVETLTALSQSRSEPAGRVERAGIVLRYHSGETVSEIARAMGTNRPRVERCMSKALELGVTVRGPSLARLAWPAAPACLRTCLASSRVVQSSLTKRKYHMLFSSQRGGRPCPKGPAQELIDAVVEMKRRNPSMRRS